MKTCNCSLHILLFIIAITLLPSLSLCLAESSAVYPSHKSYSLASTSCHYQHASMSSCHNSKQSVQIQNVDEITAQQHKKFEPPSTFISQNDPLSTTQTERYESTGVADHNHCQILKSNEVQSIAPPITTYDFNCEQLNFCDDRLGFEAILYLHRQLDEDANGDIDISESDEFIRDEFKYENGAERHKAFHGNDKHITVDELWNVWRISIVHNWTVDQTVEWLTEVVELPKYQDVFEAHSINGMALPRLAANPQLFSTLGINNPIHKQKIALKAMDVVLFGVPKPKSSNKDLIMGFLFVFATVVGWYAYYQHKYSKEHIRKMMKDIEALASAEKQLESLQMELDKTKQEHEEAFKEKRDLERKLKENEQQLNNNDHFGMVSIVDANDHNRIKELEEELQNTKCELKRIEQAYHSRQWIPSRSLQSYLQLTYEIETRYYNIKKASAEQQLQAAREGCDKLKRKRSSLFGAFRMAHGSSIDYVDNTIIQARTLLEELTQEMQERIKRWKQIESYCCFEIIHNPGLSYLEQHLYGAPVISNSSLSSSASSNSLSKLLRRSSEATLTEEDTMSLVSAPSSTYSYNLNPTIQAVQAIQMWQNHQIPTNLQIKRMSSNNIYPTQQQQSIHQVYPTTEESYVNGIFYIGDDQQPINGKINLSNLKKKSVTNSKAHLFYDNRRNSDGVEKHFEELDSNQSASQCVGSFQTNGPDSNVLFDNSSISGAYYQIPKQNLLNAYSVSEIYPNNNNANNGCHRITSTNDDMHMANQLKKDSLQAHESNEETFSTDSNDSTMTLNTVASGASNDLNNSNHDKNNKSSKPSQKRRFFSIRKRNKSSNKFPSNKE